MAQRMYTVISDESAVKIQKTAVVFMRFNIESIVID